jgi:hypothetical protein
LSILVTRGVPAAEIGEIVQDDPLGEIIVGDPA